MRPLPKDVMVHVIKSYDTGRSCRHKRIKRNYPFGKNNKSRIKCKDCGIPMKPSMFHKNRGKRNG